MCVNQKLNNLKKKLTRHPVASKSLFPGTDLLKTQMAVQSSRTGDVASVAILEVSTSQALETKCRANVTLLRAVASLEGAFMTPVTSSPGPNYTIPPSHSPTRTQEGPGSKIIVIKETKILFLLSDLSWLHTATVLHLKCKPSIVKSRSKKNSLHMLAIKPDM